MEKEAKIIDFYYPWFGLGVPLLFLMSFVGGSLNFNLDQVSVVLVVTLLVISSSSFLYLNRDVSAKELRGGVGRILFSGIFLGPTLVLGILIYILFA